MHSVLLHVDGDVHRHVLMMGNTIISLERIDGVLIGTHSLIEHAALEEVSDRLLALQQAWSSVGAG